MLKWARQVLGTGGIVFGDDNQPASQETNTEQQTTPSLTGEGSVNKPATSESASKSTPTPAKKKSHRKLMRWLILALVVVVVTAAGVWIYLTMFSERLQPESEPNNSNDSIVDWDNGTFTNVSVTIPNDKITNQTQNVVDNAALGVVRVSYSPDNTIENLSCDIKSADKDTSPGSTTYRCSYKLVGPATSLPDMTPTFDNAKSLYEAGNYRSAAMILDSLYKNEKDQAKQYEQLTLAVNCFHKLGETGTEKYYLNEIIPLAQELDPGSVKGYQERLAEL